MIQKHQKRMQEVFLRAKNHAKQSLNNRFSTEKEEELLVPNQDILDQRGGEYAWLRRMLFFVILYKDRFFIAIQRRIPALREIPGKLGRCSRGTYERCVIRAEYTKRDFVLLFIFACFVGIGMKAIAIERVTIGFEDYTMPSKSVLYDMHQIEKYPVSKIKNVSDDTAPTGEVCSDITHL
ncbi:MAG: hypothetical protein COZ27_01690 [Candidatus Moranbacteria bacterium CG_4_10_14_3_um_filter_41_65]|nr:MAG: hypothetical protein AUK58_00665 [Candidatus Moranbacteria bacterium CG2_30_41_165]PIP25356.1 MAG: hypothetical protein COX32_03990 [Candidatus Moranbacteria bacterium CG23_combo_of_CG06-09_8_20_14_all_41_28]PIV86457.1 MAG: hypothetical protein COW50_01320 [Candidatus Moranbacteria bacterium CG17_big_fil_post_rev_8_21_14_2_50_41_107]PIW93922.1 MAG: hypothetical protein COZ86_03840 [Candidatus Moranbacteria bacterium CG_4_8_14_3_um_filter_41_13]PIX91657.1 MAG: hypothetical protein COZ27_